MGPRSSISGELPIDSYFGSVGAISNKENGSRKRKTGAASGADEANWTQTKKQRTTQPRKATNLEAQGKSRSGMIYNFFRREYCLLATSCLGSVEARRQKVATAGVSKTRTTSIPTPISAVKLPHSTSSRVPADMVKTIFSSRLFPSKRISRKLSQSPPRRPRERFSPTREMRCTPRGTLLARSVYQRRRLYLMRPKRIRGQTPPYPALLCQRFPVLR
jgi:hypothetical protein